VRLGFDDSISDARTVRQIAACFGFCYKSYIRNSCSLGGLAMHGPLEKKAAVPTRAARSNARPTKQAAGVVRIPVALDERLTRLAAKTGRSKTYYARKALETFLQDTEDYLLAVASYESSNKTVSLEALRKKFKLRD
jgi:RHH-type rel operon transcriptional repressor/antitoxin RelB